MKYIGYFADIYARQYRVEVITNSSASPSREIVLSKNPFVTEMNDEDYIYTPHRYTTAKVEIVADNAQDFKLDVFSATAKGTKVILYDNLTDEVLWTGYATPQTYSGDYVGVHDILKVECLDGLSVLQYIAYTPVSENNSVRTFLEIIRHCLREAGCYSNFYISSATHLPGEGSSLIEKMVISESCFFEQKDDLTKTDTEVAWKCRDVLEEMARYLNVIMIAFGDEVYFIDYDAIKAGVNTYHKYSVYGNEAGELVTLSDEETMSSDMYAASGATLSLDEVYNKVVVKDSIYNFDEVIPGIFSLAQNITAADDATLRNSTNVNEGMYGEVVHGDIGQGTVADTNKNMIVMLDRIYNPQKHSYKDYNAVAVKYYKNQYYKFHKYRWNGTQLVDVTDDIETMNYTDSKSIYGCTPCRFSVIKCDVQSSQFFFAYIEKRISREIDLDTLMSYCNISSFSFSDYLMLTNFSEHRIDNTDITRYPYLETTVQNTAALFGGKDAYLIISGSYIYHVFDEDPYPIPDSEADISEGRYAINYEDACFIARLKWGNLYWNGMNWLPTESTFKIPYTKLNSSASDRRADAVMFKENDIRNTVTWRIGTSEKGYLIPIPQDKVISGMPEFTLYKPYDPQYISTKSGKNYGYHYKHSVVFLKDFKITAFIADPSYSDKNSTDTEYTNIIDADNVKKMDDVTFKITTWDKKSPNYSSVAVRTDNGYNWLDKTVSDGLTDGETEWTSSDDDNDGNMRQEEHLVYRTVHQYSSAAAKLSVTLRNYVKPWLLMTEPILGKKFIFNSQNINFRESTTEVNIRELK